MTEKKPPAKKTAAKRTTTKKAAPARAGAAATKKRAGAAPRKAAPARVTETDRTVLAGRLAGHCGRRSIGGSRVGMLAAGTGARFALTAFGRLVGILHRQPAKPALRGSGMARTGFML